MQKICEKLRQLRKSCHYEQLQCNCLQQLPILWLMILWSMILWSYDLWSKEIREFGWKKMKNSNYSLVASVIAKIHFYNYLVKISQKATLKFLLKSRFSVKPNKFPIYFARDCRSQHAVQTENILHDIICWVFGITVEHYSQANLAIRTQGQYLEKTNINGTFCVID